MSTPWTWRLGKGKRPWAHQVEAFDRLKDRSQRALFLEMGMGKTALETNILEYHREGKRLDRAIILAPLDLCDTWMEHLEGTVYQHGARAVNVSAKSGKEARKKLLKQAIDDGVFYIIMNYEALITLWWDLVDGLGDERFCVTCDESTFIKHHTAQRTKAVVKLGQRAAQRCVMTGTPTPQGPQDIFGQYLFLDPTIYGDRFVQFRWEWMRINQFKQILGLKPEKMEPFHERLHWPAVVMKKSEYSDLPPKVYETLYYELEGEQKKAYKDFAKDWAIQVAGGQIEASNGLTVALRLAQICTGFAGGVDEHMERVDRRFENPAKIKVLSDLIDRLEGKFVIWCAWHENVQQVMELLAKKGIKAVDYTGRTADPRANEMAFRTDPTVRAFVGLPQKGGRGLNLQGDDVKTSIYFSQGYSTEYRLQSEDRIHRGEIRHNVVVFDIVAKGTIEQSIVRGLRDNADFQNIMMKDPRGFAEGRT